MLILFVCIIVGDLKVEGVVWFFSWEIYKLLFIWFKVEGIDSEMMIIVLWDENLRSRKVEVEKMELNCWVI